VNYDDEQFTEEGTCFSLHDTYILYYSFYSPAVFVMLWRKCVLIVMAFRADRMNELPQYTRHKFREACL